MWTCPVCDRINNDSICDQCEFDHSTNFEQFPTLHKTIPQTASVSHLRDTYAARTTVIQVCRCCGDVIIGDSCSYCGFIPGDGAPVTTHFRAGKHADHVIKSLTNFSIVAYRYAWEPARSRLELQEEQLLSLGDAQDFFQNIVWANQDFGQLRNGTGTELQLEITYHHNKNKKILCCTIPTVKSDNFWRLGISLDTSFRLKLYLGAGKKFIESAPIALDLI